MAQHRHGSKAFPIVLGLCQNNHFSRVADLTLLQQRFRLGVIQILWIFGAGTSDMAFRRFWGLGRRLGPIVDLDRACTSVAGTGQGVPSVLDQVIGCCE